MSSSLSLLPPAMQTDPQLKALAALMGQRFDRLKVEIYDRLFIYNIESIEDDALLLNFAIQFRAEGVEMAETKEQKKKLIKNALQVRRLKGTKEAILKVFEGIGTGLKIEEWTEFNGEPYTFRVDLLEKTREISVATRLKFIKLINKYKNLRSHMEELRLAYGVTLPLSIFSAGSMGEVEATGRMIKAVEINNEIKAKIATVTAAAVTAVAGME